MIVVLVDPVTLAVDQMISPQYNGQPQLATFHYHGAQDSFKETWATFP